MLQENFSYLKSARTQFPIMLCIRNWCSCALTIVLTLVIMITRGGQNENNAKKKLIKLHIEDGRNESKILISKDKH